LKPNAPSLNQSSVLKLKTNDEQPRKPFEKSS
jgi:hypothetical protein